MIKRVFLFLLTNIAVIFLVWIVIFVLERVFWINISGYSTSYTSILIYSWIVWFAWAFISLFLSRWMAKKAYNIELIEETNLHKLWAKENMFYNLVSELSKNNSIKIPEVWIYESSDPNAFATGASKNSSLVAVSTGLLDKMNEKELRWVIGHEMAHILNGDMVTMTLLQWVVNTFVIFLSRILSNIFNNVTDWKYWSIWYFVVNMLLQIVFWILASVVVMWFSRYREFRADEWSSKLVWKENMIAWLEALKKMVNLTTDDNSKLATMKINTKHKSWFMSLFSSHPDLDDRIENLRNFNSY